MANPDGTTRTSALYSDKRIRCALIGASGRLGTSLLRESAESRLEICQIWRRQDRIRGDSATTNSPSTKTKQRHLPEERILEKLMPPSSNPIESNPESVSLVIDVSIADVPQVYLPQLTWKPALLIGSTGHSEETLARLQKYSSDAPVLIASNGSHGSAIHHRLTQNIGRLMPDASAEIIESHHQYKLDAPSGTAKTLREHLRLGHVQAHSHSECTIPIHSLRGGDVIGEHRVVLYLEGERIEITHTVDQRRVFALGLARMGEWLFTQKPGLYDQHSMFVG